MLVGLVFDVLIVEGFMYFEYVVVCVVIDMVGGILVGFSGV